ncbi:MAG TPA: AmpG family muropeptide MFS transporter [Longimicrobiales bacterium]
MQAKTLSQVFTQRKMAAILLLGFASGLPLWLTARTLQAWMTVEGVDLTLIGLFALVTLPYSLKFLWAPFLDRYVPPFLGRRRGWLVITQLLLMLSIGAMALIDPSTSLKLLALNAVLIAFFSASQDIVYDAYKIDVLEERELGAGAAIGVLGYRIALLVTGSLAFVLADQMPWPMVYVLMALLMLVGVGASFWAPEPLVVGKPQSMREAVVLPFRDFFQRMGGGWFVVIMLFTILYQMSDRLGQNMVTPFLLEIGFTQTEIGAIQGGIGLISTIVGVIAGGAIIARIGVNRALWAFLLLQIASNLAYYWIAMSGPDRGILTVAIIIENLSGGMVTAVFVAYLMSLCSRQFSATQFALLSSVMAAARDVLVTPAGAIAESTGWPTFFMITIAAGLPAALMLPIVAPWRAEHPRGAAIHHGETEEEAVGA